LRSLIKANLTALKELHDLVDCFSSGQYANSPMADLSPPGKHVRHVTDHYYAFADGIQVGVIDYDQRSRESAQETCQVASAQCLQHIQSNILSPRMQDRPVKVVTTVDADQKPYSLVSTLRRELIYLLNHTVHHTAMLSMVARVHGVVQIPSGGVAPSTQRWENINRITTVLEPDTKRHVSQA